MHQARKILCASDVPVGGDAPRTLSVVECADGAFRLYLNGEAVAGCAWGVDNLKECIDAFLSMRLALRLSAARSAASCF